jgi:hypothetical protein
MLINVVDASNLERNLYLTLQLLELGISIPRPRVDTSGMTGQPRRAARASISIRTFCRS